MSDTIIPQGEVETYAVLNAEQARIIAEWASGYRGEYMTFYVNAATGKIHGKKGKPGQHPAGVAEEEETVVMVCDTPYQVPGRRPIGFFTIQGKDLPGEIDLLNLPVRDDDGVVRYYEADGVFTSESAVEKFLFPYYASKGDWNGNVLVDRLKKAFYEPRLTGAEGADAAVEGENGQYAAVPYALAHIPKSDYVELDGTDPMPEAAVIHLDPKTGKITATRATAYVRKYL